MKKNKEKVLKENIKKLHLQCIKETKELGRATYVTHGKRCESLGRFDEYTKLITKTNKVIDDRWEELIFDLHTRFCRMDDVGGKTHEMCNKFKEQLKEDLKRMIK